MNRTPAFAAIAAVLAALPLAAASDDAVPVQDENLAYTINYASGLSLGEARLLSHRAGDRWYFELALDAGVPGFAVSDHFRSVADSGLCAVEFERETLHGKRRSREKTTFDGRKGTAWRVTLNGGGKSEVKIPACVHDALGYVIYARRELGQGRVPRTAKVFFGAQYQVRLEFAGPQNISYGDKKARADRVVATVKGPASSFSVEVFFAQDGPRTPLLIKVPLAVGTLSAELVR